MLRVYLDQNKGIDLARAATGHPAGARYTEALDTARTAVGGGHGIISARHVSLRRDWQAL